MARQAAAATACALIRPDAIAHNLRLLRNRLAAGIGKPPAIWAVVKADAYGHGVAHALTGLAQADGLAVSTLAGARRLRGLGWRKPVLVINPDAEGDLQQACEIGLQPLHLVIYNQLQVDSLANLDGSAQLHVWLRHSGMLQQLGLHRETYTRAWRSLQELQRAGRLAGVGHMQHYAAAEDVCSLRRERRAFESVMGALPGARCTENSAAVLNDPDYARTGDWVRSGIALYGISPLDGSVGADLGLQPAMALQAPIFATQTVAAGRNLGYGMVFRADRDLRIGLVACGYADGYPCNIAPDCPVSINGRLGRVVGRVAMDTLTVDLTDHPQASTGTMVTLWGTPELPIEHVAHHAGTIPAQLCSSVMARVPRRAVALKSGID